MHKWAWLSEHFSKLKETITEHNHICKTPMTLNIKANINLLHKHCKLTGNLPMDSTKKKLLIQWLLHGTGDTYPQGLQLPCLPLRIYL